MKKFGNDKFRNWLRLILEIGFNSKNMIWRKWKRVSTGRNSVVDDRKRMNIMALRWIFIFEWPHILSVLARGNRIFW